MPKYCAVIVLTLFLGSCNSNTVMGDSKSLSGGFWNKDEAVSFTISELDSTASYDVFLHVRNSNSYKYNNLYLIVDLKYPFGKTVTDTLEYRIANPDGSWLGEGIGDIKENKFWYKESIQFTEPGEYTLLINHAVRNNGDANGVSNLEGIMDVGFSIEQAIQY